MPRPCSVCRNSSIGDISADIANGVTDKEISRRYSLSKSSVQRHRQHLGAPNSATVIATKGAAFAALAALPTREEAGSACYPALEHVVDAIAEKAESAGDQACRRPDGAEGTSFVPRSKPRRGLRVRT